MNSKRSYLVSTLPFSINPEIALQMNEIAGFDENDRILDPCCGTATILIERQLAKPCYCLGVDIDPRALECARKNITAANLNCHPELAEGSLTNASSNKLRDSSPSAQNDIHLKHGDIMEQNFPAGYFTKIISNLPFGIHTGSREKNLKLYNFLAQASGDWLRSGGKVILLTTAKKILWNAFADKPNLKFVQEVPFRVRGLTPSLFVFEKI